MVERAFVKKEGRFVWTDQTPADRAAIKLGSACFALIGMIGGGFIYYLIKGYREMYRYFAHSDQ